MKSDPNADKKSSFSTRPVHLPTLIGHGKIEVFALRSAGTNSTDLESSDLHLLLKLNIFVADERFSFHQEAISAVEGYFADLCRKLQINALFQWNIDGWDVLILVIMLKYKTDLKTVIFTISIQLKATLVCILSVGCSVFEQLAELNFFSVQLFIYYNDYALFLILYSHCHYI